jgi:hypothetical protein
MNRALMIIFVDAEHASDIEQLLEDCEVPGYTEIPTVLGKGATGRKLGTRAFPGSSTVYLVAVDDTCREPLAQRLRALRDERGPAEGLKVFAVDSEEVL